MSAGSSFQDGLVFPPIIDHKEIIASTPDHLVVGGPVIQASMRDPAQEIAIQEHEISLGDATTDTLNLPVPSAEHPSTVLDSDVPTTPTTVVVTQESLTQPPQAVPTTNPSIQLSSLGGSDSITRITSQTLPSLSVISSVPSPSFITPTNGTGIQATQNPVTPSPSVIEGADASPVGGSSSSRTTPIYIGIAVGTVAAVACIAAFVACLFRRRAKRAKLRRSISLPWARTHEQQMSGTSGRLEAGTQIGEDSMSPRLTTPSVPYEFSPALDSSSAGRGKTSSRDRIADRWFLPSFSSAPRDRNELGHVARPQASQERQRFPGQLSYLPPFDFSEGSVDDQMSSLGPLQIANIMPGDTSIASSRAGTALGMSTSGSEGDQGEHDRNDGSPGRALAAKREQRLPWASPALLPSQLPLSLAPGARGQMGSAGHAGRRASGKAGEWSSDRQLGPRDDEMPPPPANPFLNADDHSASASAAPIAGPGWTSSLKSSLGNIFGVAAWSQPQNQQTLDHLTPFPTRHHGVLNERNKYLTKNSGGVGDDIVQDDGDDSKSTITASSRVSSDQWTIDKVVLAPHQDEVRIYGIGEDDITSPHIMRSLGSREGVTMLDVDSDTPGGGEEIARLETYGAGTPLAARTEALDESLSRASSIYSKLSFVESGRAGAGEARRVSGLGNRQPPNANALNPGRPTIVTRTSTSGYSVEHELGS